MSTFIPASPTSSTSSSPWRSTSELTGRVLLATLFLVSGLGKITTYGATAAYMESTGIPGSLLWCVISLEILGAIAIMIGYKTRITAATLSLFTLTTGFVFHSNFADPTQVSMFLKNLSIGGAFLILAATGAGPYSFDARASR